MLKPSLPVYLASKSPRRKKLLRLILDDFRVLSTGLDEIEIVGEKPEKMVKRLSEEKLEAAIRKNIQGIIITADTTVSINGKILGKPNDEKEAAEMLKTLSGKTHTVYTGFSVYNSKKKIRRTAYEKTDVTFRKLNLPEIKEYIKTGSPMDKAGAYGIQDDFGAVFIEKINGCYYNVVGLPLTKLYLTLEKII
jgi:nucleoside triphosphate pyrophosphatase